MVVTLDEDLTEEEQLLFGEIYNSKGRRVQWCRYCGHYGVYLIRNNHDTIILLNLEDDSIHCCVPMQCVKGETTFQ